MIVTALVPVTVLVVTVKVAVLLLAATVTLDGTPVELTTAEFDLLWLLASRAGEVVTRDQISHALHGHEWDGLDRSIDLCISRLRKKLGDDGRKPDRVRSIRGTGYMWVAD